MQRIHLTSLAALGALAFAGGPVQAQSSQSLAAAFAKGLKACVLNVTGKLPLNPPSQAQTEAGLVLADPIADQLGAFADLSPSQRMFAVVPSATGQVVVASDSTQSLCRTVAYGLKAGDVAAIQAAVNAYTGDWTQQSNDAGQNLTTFSGTVAGSKTLNFRVRQPTQGFGGAGFMLTALNPAP